MGFSSDEFLRMREMERFRFDYYEPVMCERHYWFDIEADSREEAIEKAKELINNGNVYNFCSELVNHSELYINDELIKTY